MNLRVEHTPFGFNFGAAEVERCCSDDKKGWTITTIRTPRTVIAVYVTKTGKVRVHEGPVEWKPVK